MFRQQNDILKASLQTSNINDTFSRELFQHRIISFPLLTNDRMREIRDAVTRDFPTLLNFYVGVGETWKWKTILFNFPRHERQNFPFSSVIFQMLDKSSIARVYVYDLNKQPRTIWISQLWRFASKIVVLNLLKKRHTMMMMISVLKIKVLLEPYELKENWFEASFLRLFHSMHYL